MAKSVPLSKVLWFVVAAVISVVVFRACYSGTSAVQKMNQEEPKDEQQDGTP